MSLADELSPNKKYDRVEAALPQLKPEDREAWLGALDSRDYSYTYLGELLSKHTSEEVDRNAVAHYARKKGFRRGNH